MRFRAALGAALAVAVILVVGAFGFVALLTGALRANIEESAALDAEAAATSLESSGSTTLPDDDRLLVLVDESGRVVSASDEDIALPEPVPNDDVFTARVDGDEVVFASEDVEIGDTDYRLLAGRSLDDANDAVATVTGLLGVAVPLIVLLVGTTTWIVVGRSLAPVERIRSEVASIEASGLDRRVPVPPSGDEIARLAETMNGMLARLEGASIAQRRFVSDASHELRSPLASIRQYAEVASLHPDRIDASELSATVLAEGARLQAIIESLLILAKLDESAATIDRRPVDLDDILLTECSRLRSSTTLAIDGSSITAARVSGDERLLARVIRNLADNAARHARSQIAVASTDADGVVTIVVEDDGSGVPAPERSRVFDRFVRLDESRARDAGGSGLGLAIVADIVRAHGGSVAVEDSAVGGARLVVRLPAS
ncbi:ATP-binding protein [Agromyces atrinae]|uniref:sensor histidine kinase n=1 Tax=Agromyces atrinae TaxID=592376 RepID=UPI001F5705FD|nr:ATP-binding protein [Agromyces atrinae]MCI2956733.1 ATP-binding protein [Agromyces atrinae]